jgi:CheY-like chemotaxis protein
MTIERQNVHLLVIEDNPRFLDELLEWLNDFGYQNMITATSAADAEKKLNDPCDVVVADMRMEQDDSGFTLLDWVKTKNISAVVIILTANDTVSDCRRAFREGAWDYISKNMKGNPFDALDDSIKNAILYLNRWGNQPNQQWLDENMNELESQYWGQWLAIANQTIIETADSETALLKRLDERKLRRFTTTIKRIGNLRPISDLIKLSESNHLEFKSTLQWDVRQESKNEKLQLSVLKTIAAFLNSDGGTLLIGVADDGSVFGLEKDIETLKKGDLDKFERHLIQLVTNSIGSKFMPYLTIRFEQIEGKYVCAIYVRSSGDKRAFLKLSKGVELYIRAGNSSRSLSIPELYDYL